MSMARDEVSRARSELGEDVRALREDFNSLRGDMQELLRAVLRSGRESASETGQRLQSEALQRVERLGQGGSRAGGVREAGRRGMAQMQSRAGRHPVLSVSMALGAGFGAGFVTGRFLRRRR